MDVTQADKNAKLSLKLAYLNIKSEFKSCTTGQNFKNLVQVLPFVQASRNRESPRIKWLPVLYVPHP